jgi:hypothetical protein
VVQSYLDGIERNVLDASRELKKQHRVPQTLPGKDRYISLQLCKMTDARASQIKETRTKKRHFYRICIAFIKTLKKHRKHTI